MQHEWPFPQTCTKGPRILLTQPTRVVRVCPLLLRCAACHQQPLSSPGCPHLAVQMWDDSVTALQPLRSFVDDACGLFPAFLDPFLRLATGLIVGPEAAEACYDYLSKRPPLVVEFTGPGQPGLQVCCCAGCCPLSCVWRVCVAVCVLHSPDSPCS